MWPGKLLEPFLVSITCSAELVSDWVSAEINSFWIKTGQHISFRLERPNVDNNGDLRYSVLLVFGYSKSTWQNANGSYIMTHYCHAEKLSLGFSIHKCTLCECVSVFLCPCQWNQRMASPRVGGSIVIWFSDLWAQVQTVESSWAHERHRNTKDDSVALFHEKEAFVFGSSSQ